MTKHSLRLARMARMDLTPNPAKPAPRRARANGLAEPEFDDTPTDTLPVVDFAEPDPAELPMPPLSPLSDPPSSTLPGSAGEHLLQLAYGTRNRAERFYDDQMSEKLNDTMIEFVGRMEMAFIATADARGEADCSFRAGPPGFIQVLDPQHVAYPEYRGNGVLASLGNISENPHVGIMLLDFVRDRIGLHINGRAMIVEDDVLRTEFPFVQADDVRGRQPERWVLVEIDEAYIHCRKHIPGMRKVPADQAWGTDDVKRKGGDYFGVKAARAAEATESAEAAEEDEFTCSVQSRVNGS